MAFGGSWFLPCLGFLFLPFTTIVYVWMQTPFSYPVNGIEWVLLGLCVVLHIFSAGHAVYANRNRIP